jgi:hypothetical protein
MRKSGEAMPEASLKHFSAFAAGVLEKGANTALFTKLFMSKIGIL